MEVVKVESTSDITKMNQLLVCDSSQPIVISLKRLATGISCGYYIKNIGAGSVTVAPMANDFIDSAATKVLAQWQSIYIMDYSLHNWIIISNNYVQ
jgi:hypothetical protein